MTKDPIDIALGARLLELRERRGLSMSAVGREIQITYQQVRKYETGENRISAATLFRLSELLGVEVGEFFRGMPASTEVPQASAPHQADVDALDQIGDREVRHHLAGLLQALGSRS